MGLARGWLPWELHIYTCTIVSCHTQAVAWFHLHTLGLKAKIARWNKDCTWRWGRMHAGRAVVCYHLLGQRSPFRRIG